MSNENTSKGNNEAEKDWANGIGFLFKKCDAPRTSLAYWVTVPEFVEKIKKASSKAVTIDNAYILNVMSDIYKTKQQEKLNGNNVKFNFHLSRQSLKMLSEILYGDRNSWEDCDR